MTKQAGFLQQEQATVVIQRRNRGDSVDASVKPLQLGAKSSGYSAEPEPDSGRSQ